ncbi:MAG: hypothetical protein Q9M13_03415, partial [Mariprofundales bacterium]|nr:hypothetical protein [Mariprofundales bacterium]
IYGLNDNMMTSQKVLQQEKLSLLRKKESSVFNMWFVGRLRRKQRVPPQTESERRENGENQVAGEMFRKDVKTAENL